MLLSTDLVSGACLSSVVGDLLVTKCQNSSVYVSKKEMPALLGMLDERHLVVLSLQFSSHFAVLCCIALVLPCSVALSGVFNQTLIPLSKYRNIFHF